MSDPLAVFRTLSDDAPDLGTAGDVADMKSAVAAMRRGRRLAPPSPAQRLLAADWRRAAAVAAVTLGMLSLAAGGWQTAERSGEEATAAALEAAAAAEIASPGDDPSTAAPVEEWANRPVFEGIDSPRSASVYELAGENLDVVMVVDETLNI